MKKIMKTMLLFLLLFAFSMLSGCSSTGNIEQSTIVVKKDGTVLGVILEDFSDSRYVSDELKAMLEEEITAYNSQAGEGKVTLDSYEITEDNHVKIIMSYASYKDYAGFNEETFFVGTVSEAYDAGYEFADMESVSNEGASLEKADVLEKGNMHILIFNEAVHVRVNGKIAYVSQGVSLVDKKEAASADEEETIEQFYVIYE